MKDGISRLIYHCYKNMLWEEWLSWKIGLYNRHWEGSITVEMYFLDRWTWYIIISLEEIFIERKPKSTPEKVNAILWVIRERFYELLEKDTYLLAITKDLKLYINKFVHNKGLIYLETRNFERTKDYLAE